MPENIAELIPEGISQVYWDYYNNSENMYNTMIREHIGCFPAPYLLWISDRMNLMARSTASLELYQGS